MKTLVFVAAVLALAGQRPAKPQAFVSHATGKQVAVYTPDTETIRITATAPPTLRICLKDICKTPDQWLDK